VLIAESVDPTRFVFACLAGLLWLLSVSGFIVFVFGVVKGDLAHPQYGPMLLVLLFAASGCSVFARLLYGKTRDAAILVSERGHLLLALPRGLFRENTKAEVEDAEIVITGVSYEILPRWGKAREENEHLTEHSYGLWICVAGSRTTRRVILHSSYEARDQAFHEASALRGALDASLDSEVGLSEIKRNIKIACRVY